MGSAERRQRERQELRDRILDAARGLFVEQGYEAVTMRRIAERIEYSATAIYFHFRDKEALFRELCQTDFRFLSSKLRSIGSVPDPVERLRRIGRAYLRFAKERPNHYRLMFMTPHPPVDPDAVDIERGNPEEDAWAMLRESVSDALAADRLTGSGKDPDAVAQLFWAGVHGVVSLHLAKGNDDWVPWRPVDETADRMIDTLIRGLEAAPKKAAAPWRRLGR